jgi:hypothetical protein
LVIQVDRNFDYGNLPSSILERKKAAKMQEPAGNVLFELFRDAVVAVCTRGIPKHQLSSDSCWEDMLISEVFRIHADKRDTLALSRHAFRKSWDHSIASSSPYRVTDSA